MLLLLAIHIKTETFPASGSASFGSNAEPIFSNSFRNYKIVARLFSSINTQTVIFRMRSNITDDNSAGYFRFQLSATGVSTSVAQGNTQTAGFFALCDQSGAFVSADVSNPFLTDRTFLQVQGVDTNNNIRVQILGTNVANSTSYNGITLIGGSGGTINGTISFYGYKE